MYVHAIRFVLDGEVVTLRDFEPTRTVLEYLREDLGRTGTKEGCAEGDCGACTVALLEARGDAANPRLHVRAVNACIQFVGTLHGRELLTVESLGTPDDLHPAQRAMVTTHGSQCGFCTPGFVMALFALYKANAAPAREAIDVALSGNLCRCTGYRPIVAAARAMHALAPQSDNSASDWLRAAPDDPAGADDARERWHRLHGIQTGCGPRHAECRFFAPTSLAELDALCAEQPGAQLLAGGTDVGLWVTKQLRDFESVIHLGRVPELLTLDVTEQHVEVGAALPLEDALPTLVEHFEGLRELLLRFASPLIRNAATLGGNIANGSPIGDSMPALLALGATLMLRREGHERELPLAAFYRGYRDTALAPGEFITRIRIPRLGAGTRFAAYKLSKRFDQDISAVCGAFFIERDGARRVCTARCAFGGMAATPARAPACEAALTGRPLDAASVAAAAQALDDDFQPIDDLRASARYRLRAAGNLLRRFQLDVDGVSGARLPAPGLPQ